MFSTMVSHQVLHHEDPYRGEEGIPQDWYKDPKQECGVASPAPSSKEGMFANIVTSNSASVGAGTFSASVGTDTLSTSVGTDTLLTLTSTSVVADTFLLTTFPGCCRALQIFPGCCTPWLPISPLQWSS